MQLRGIEKNKKKTLQIFMKHGPIQSQTEGLFLNKNTRSPLQGDHNDNIKQLKLLPPPAIILNAWFHREFLLCGRKLNIGAFDQLKVHK